MGAVYKARDTRLGRFVAIKQLDSEHGGRFRQEARAIAALNHPHICQVYDVGPDYLVMEYVEGHPLAGPLPEPEVIRLARQIVSALEEAHTRGILHRDLKPGNILTSGSGSAKLIDFGLAKQLITGASDETRTKDATLVGTITGTLAYMSPEQAQAQALDERSDIFSLGAVLYELLTGKRAFAGDSAVAVVAAVLRDDPPPFTASPGFARVIKKCLSKKPSDRYASAAELRAELDSLAEHRRNLPASALAAAPMAAPVNVGRESTVAEMGRAYECAKTGRAPILAITGEAGIGKTSVLEAFFSSLLKLNEDPIIGRGRCSQRLAGEEPYLPILESLEGILGLHSGLPIAEVMRDAAPTWYNLVAEDTSASSAPRPANSQERMKREFVALCQEISALRPLILFIDDLHWADISTVDILNHLTTHFRKMRVLVITTYRPSDMALAGHPFLGIRNDLQSRGLFEEIALTFLERRDVERYLDLEFPGHAFPPDFAGVIHAKTEGSPLFIADLLRYLRDTGGIVQEDGRWAMARSLPEAPRDLPASVRGMIQRKIEQVGENDLKLLLAAAVQGPEFDSAVVSEALGLEPADVEERLDILERVHFFVRRSAESEFPDRSLTVNYQFVHVLYQNALYDSLQPTRRASLSGRVAQALVSRYGSQVGAVAARIAVLFNAARDFSSSAQYYHMAACRSAELFAFREALALAEHGLDALKGLPDGPARKQQELVLQMMKGIALRSTTGWATPQIEGTFAKARQLCQDLSDPPELIPVLWATTLFVLIRGDLRACRERADDLMDQASRSGQPVYLMAANHMAGVVREFMGDMVDANRLLECCRQLHDPARFMEYNAMFGQDPGMVGRAMSARPLFALGYPDRALERAQETLALARAQHQPALLAFVLVVLQGVHCYRGEGEAARARGDEIAALCREYELPQEAQWSLAFQGYALHLLGRTEEGIAMLKSSLAAQDAISARLVRTAFLAMLADALWAAGRYDEGLNAVAEGIDHAGQSTERGYLAELLRIRGQLLHATGNPVGAEASLREAIECAASQQAKSFELRAASSLAEWMIASNRHREAHELLSPIYEWFTEGHDTADLVRARTLLAGTAELSGIG
jgi:predicted ATPase/tRNA A-37 threonylcarbamoyl transferase component Bud32